MNTDPGKRNRILKGASTIVAGVSNEFSSTPSYDCVLFLAKVRRMFKILLVVVAVAVVMRRLFEPDADFTDSGDRK
jgi:hypothetical protein